MQRFIYFLLCAAAIHSFRRCAAPQKWRLRVAATDNSADEDQYEEEVKENKETISIIYRKRKRSLDGYDARNIRTNETAAEMQRAEEETAEFMTKFNETYAKKQLLDKLQDPNIPIAQKIDLLASSVAREIRPARININTLDW